MKKFLALLLVLVFLPCLSCAETVVTSFYPVWLMALNLTDGLEDVKVRNLATPDTGCLHHYSLQMGDMKTLAKADVFLINGAGMEAFLPELVRAFPDLPVVEASAGISLLEDGSAVEIGEHEEGESVNAHIWLDPSRAAQMADNLAAGLVQAFPQYEQQISANLEAYRARLLALDRTLREGLSGLPNRRIVTFHEAFPYFAEAYGLEVVAVVNKEPGETLTPMQLAELSRQIVTLGYPPLFVEPQYTDLSAQTLANQTGALVYSLDPVVTGPEEDVPLDYYETVMLQNMAVLQQALQ